MDMNYEGRDPEMLKLVVVNYILCFIFLTLSEIVFTIFYLLLFERVDALVLAGALLYALSMMTCYSGYKAARYKWKTTKMLHSFLL